MIRTFIAVDIPRFQEVDVLIDRLRGSGARLSVPKSHGLHITLKFLGDIEESSVGDILDLMHGKAVDFASFEARIAQVGAFPKLRNPKVLWIGVDEEGKLAEIAKVIDMELSSLGFELEKRPFRSHITVGRVKSRFEIDKAINIIREYENTQFGVFEVKELKLKKSTLTPTGAIYDDLGVIQFGKQSETD